MAGTRGAGEVWKTEFNKIFAPHLVSPKSEAAGVAYRARLGEEYLAQEQFDKLGKVFYKMGERLTPNQSLDFTEAAETGKSQAVPALQPMADALRANNDRMLALAQKEGYLDEFVPDYMGHIYKQGREGVDTRLLSYGAKLGLPSGWLKERKYGTQKFAVEELGLEPATYNPVTMQLTKAAHMMNFLTTTKFFKDLDGLGLRKFVREGELAPEGFEVRGKHRLDEVTHKAEVQAGEGTRTATVREGHYYYPQEVAALVDRVVSKGWEGNKLFETARGVENALNITQLGLSPFHLWFVTSDAMSSSLGLAIREATQGQWKSSARHFAEGITPAAGPIAAYRGRQLRLAREAAWKGTGPAAESFQELVQPSIEAAAKSKIPDMYKFWESEKPWRQLETETPTLAGKAAKVATFPIDLMAHVAKYVSKPLMEVYVPAVKMGAWSEMMRSSLQAQPEMTPAERKRLAQYHWDSVEDRMGELNTDLTFMPKSFVNSMWLAVRSFGWKFGDVRLLSGGVMDAYKDVLYGLDRGEGSRYTKAGAPGLSDRTAYLLGSVMVNALGATAMQLAFTGELPKDLEDLLFPRDGTMDAHGKPNRRAWWGYVKDQISFFHAPLQEVENSLSPFYHAVKEYITETDGAGRAIVDPYSTKGEQRMQWLKWGISQYLPIGLKTKSREAGREQERDWPSTFGVGYAPSFTSRTSEERIHQAKMRQPVRRKWRAGGFDW
jgi:hypothetical protein